MKIKNEYREQRYETDGDNMSFTDIRITQSRESSDISSLYMRSRLSRLWQWLMLWIT
jgi:hypothetical protein